MRVLRASTKRPLDLLAISTAGQVAAASSSFGVRGDVEVWDAATGQHIYTHPVSVSEAFALAFTAEGMYLFVGESESISILHVTTGRRAANPPVILGHPEFAFSLDGTRLLQTESVDTDSGLGFYAFRADRTFRRIWSERPPSHTLYDKPAVSPAGNRVAVSMHDGSRDRVRNNVQIRDAATGKVQFEIEFGASDPLEQIVFSADGSKVLARSSGRTVKVFDAATGQPAGELVHPGRPYVTGMAVHPGGTIACCRTNGTVCLWEPEKHTLARLLDWKLGKLVSVAFSPDGSIGAAGTEDGQVVVWDVDP